MRVRPLLIASGALMSGLAGVAFLAGAKAFALASATPGAAYVLACAIGALALVLACALGVRAIASA